MEGINRILQLTWEIAEKPTDDKTRLQAFAQLDEGYRFRKDLTTNGVVTTDAIKLVQTNKEKLMPLDNDKESYEPDHDDEDNGQLEEKQEEET
jgi:hypothetical protein